MKLISFSVTNYRSITAAHKISLSNMTVLVGKNNEGKSNLLTALNIAMMAIINNSQFEVRQRIAARRARSRFLGYDWERDFPVQLQNRKSGLESIFTLVFRLEGSELDEFHSETKIGGNEDIPIRIIFSKDNKYKIEVPKRGSSSYNKKSAQITEFISKRISFNYIQAVRTEDMALSALMDVITEELRGIENDKAFQDAQSKIIALQQKVLDNISKTLVSPLKTFLPNLKDIKITKEPGNIYGRLSYRDEIDVIVDDGIPTSISFKGDGIKSLVTLAILKERQNSKAASIIAIEEPESHLHSGAIHSLCDVINKISENSQVILTTHNPLFVQQNYVKSNIIVNNGKATPAKSIAEIRNVLGVLPSDNLKNANKVLVVEGEDDLISLRKILSLKSKMIETALKNNIFVITPLRGASNLSHDLLDLKTNMCRYVVLLDNDSAGWAAYQSAYDSRLLSEAEVKFTICNGAPESEFEDCIKSSTYEKLISDKYGVNICCKEFHNNNKWSDRMKNVFLSQGSHWNDKIEQEIKFLIANNLPNDIDEILVPQKSGFIDGLIIIIEKMLNSNEFL